MESTDNRLLIDDFIGKLIYVIHLARKTPMHAAGILVDYDNDYIKLNPPTIEILDREIETEAKNWLLENPTVIQFAEALVPIKSLVLIKNLETADEVLRKYVEKQVQGNEI